MLTKCSIVKRIFASLMDILCVLFLGTIIYYSVGVNLFNTSFNLENKIETARVEQIKTGLYYNVNSSFEIQVDYHNTKEEIISSLKNNDMLIDLKNLVYRSSTYNSQTYIEGIEYFYSLINQEDKLNELKLSSGLFTLNQFKDIPEEEKISFCDQIYQNIPSLYESYNDGMIVNLLFEINILKLSLNGFSYFIPIIIFFFIIPLIHHKSMTLGQMVYKITVVDKYNIFARWNFLALRTLAIIFELVLGLMSFGLIPLISFTMMLILKNGTCLHDLISFTYVIDSSIDPCFKNLDEYQEYILKLQMKKD